MRNFRPYKRPLDVRMWHHLARFGQMLAGMERSVDQLRVLSEVLAAADRMEPVPFPVWADRKVVYQLFGIPSRVLTRLRTEGVVRTAKFREARRSATLCRVEDVDRALLAMAAGRNPTRPRHQATRTVKRRE
jgi:hypothetical protein